MKNIDTLSSIEGRILLNDIFMELRYEKQMSSLSVLLLCWRICVNEREVFRYVKKEVTILHKLGVFAGTGLWLEEIVNRFYYSTFNSFVYLGAAVLLVLIGYRRFNENISTDVIIGGIGFEAFMLILLFIIMLFTPNEDLTKSSFNGKEEDATANEILIEIGEISRDLAGAVVQLEKLGNSYQDILDKNNYIMQSVNKLAENSSMAVSPNPDMLETMKDVNNSLKDLKNTVDNLNKAAESLKRDEIEIAVRKEVERILVDRVNHQ
ncbi:MAG: hypothetical protein ABSG15_02355 [FCB group bacterium]|jgi:uncharacterized protein YoxC